jgi:hypothetical protein
MSSPACQEPVPALSIWTSSARSRLSARCFRTISAVGERQMLPEQTKQIRTGWLGTSPVCQGVWCGLKSGADEELVLGLVLSALCFDRCPFKINSR